MGGNIGEPPERVPPEDGGRTEVVVPNVFDFNRTFMDPGFSCSGRLAWSAGALGISECSLLWGGGDKRALLPLDADPLWVDDVREGMGYSRLETFRLPTRLSFPEELREKLAGGPEKAKLLPWGASEVLHSLSGFLGKEHFLLEGETAPKNSFFEAVNLDSKAGFRLAASQHGCGDLMPRGVVAPGLREALEILPGFVSGGGGVLKASQSTGGISVALFPERGFSPAAARRTMEARARWDPFWRQSPVIVEELIAGGGASPAMTADFFIGAKGSARLFGAGLMRIAAGTRYCGVVAGKGAMGEGLRSEVLKAGERTGGILAGRGVRGWFNLDFAVDGGSRAYVTEVNVRRSLATHLFEAAKFLYGEGWEEKRAFLANDHLAFMGKRPDYGLLRRGFAGFNREGSSRGAWALPTSVNGGLRRNPPRISFILTAKDSGGLPAEEAELIARLERETECRCGSPPFPVTP